MRESHKRFSVGLASAGLSIFRVSSIVFRGRACAWLAARSDATCIKTSTRPAVKPLFGRYASVTKTYRRYPRLDRFFIARVQSGRAGVLFEARWLTDQGIGERERILPQNADFLILLFGLKV